MKNGGGTDAAWANHRQLNKQEHGEVPEMLFTKKITLAKYSI